MYLAMADLMQEYSRCSFAATANNPSCELRGDGFEGICDNKEGGFEIESFSGNSMNAPWHSGFDA